MSINSKLAKTATSVSLAILGLTQLKNNANAKIVQGGANLTQLGFGTTFWQLDSVPGYGDREKLSIVLAGGSLILAVVGSTQNNYAGFGYGNLGDIVSANANPGRARLLFRAANGSYIPDSSGYFAFKDYTANQTPVYGWAQWSTVSPISNWNITLNQWYYEDIPGASIKIGDRGTAVPFDFNPLHGVASGIPIFMGLRHLKRRKLNQNSIASTKRKEKIHPLALLGMGAAGVRKWREQKDRDAA